MGQELIAHDRLRTGEDSRAAVRFGDSTVLRIDELTEEEILPPQVAGAKPTLDLKQGSAYFFSREKSREIHVQTPAANGAIRGTEFVVTVAANGSTSFTILDGEVEISNSQGSVSVQSGERAEIQPGGRSDQVRRDQRDGFGSMVFLLSGRSRFERAGTFSVRAGQAARITLGLWPGRRTARA